MRFYKEAKSPTMVGLQAIIIPKLEDPPRVVSPLQLPMTLMYRSNLLARAKKLKTWRLLIRKVSWLRSSRKTDEEVFHGQRRCCTIDRAVILAKPGQSRPGPHGKLGGEVS